MKKLITLIAVLVLTSTTLFSQPPTPGGNPTDDTSSVDVSAPLATESLLLIVMCAGYYGYKVLKEKKAKKVKSRVE
jgi:hypothetical protein